MLKFFNKKGKKVMEMRDNGDLEFVAEELKKTGLFEKVVKTEDKEDKEEKDEQ